VVSFPSKKTADFARSSALVFFFELTNILKIFGSRRRSLVPQEEFFINCRQSQPVKPCIRGLRITVGDVLGWLAAGMTRKEIIEDFPDLTEEDIQACQEYAAAREQHATIALTPR
jgi:uncharacterized protein (DUF433 family)